MENNYEKQDYLADLLAGKTEKWYCPYIKDGERVWRKYHTGLPIIGTVLRDETFEEWFLRKI